MQAPDRRPQLGSTGAALISAGGVASGEIADGASRRARAFLHELSNLIDGSLRSVKLAQKDIAAGAGGATCEGALAHAARRLEAAASALLHMVELIRGLQEPLIGARAGGRAFEQPRPLTEAITHAVEVLRPLAEERGITLEAEIAPSVAAAPPFPVYAVVMNAVRNAVEAIGRRPGVVHIHAEARPEPEGRGLVTIEVADDGPGPSPEAERCAFAFGFSTKEGASGIGLALAQDIVRQSGGEITLSARRRDDARRGALLRITIPFAMPGGARP